MKQVLTIVIIMFSLSVWAIESWEGYTCPYQVKDICEDGDYLWLATSGGLVKVEKDTGEHEIFNTSNSQLSTNFINTVEIDSQGNLWIGTSMGIVDDMNMYDYSGGVHIWHPDNTWTYYNTANSPLLSNLISDITFDGQGNTWISTYRGGVSKISVDGTWEVFTSQNTEMNSDNATSLAVTDDGVWIGLMSYHNGVSYVGGGLVYFDNGVMTDYTSLLTPRDFHDLNELYIDESGVLWIAAGYERFYRYDGSEMVQFSIPEFLMGIADPTVYAIYVKNDVIYLGTSCGLTIYDGDNWQQYNTTNSCMYEYNLSSLLIDAEDILWCGSSFWGLYRFDDGAISEYSILDQNTEFKCPYLYDIAIAEDQSVWLANGYNLLNNGAGGMVHFDGEDQWELFDYSATQNLVFNDICIDNDIVYIASGNSVDYGGIVIYDEGMWRRYDYNSTNGGFPYVCADDIAVGGNGVIYASCCNGTGGIACYDGENWQIIDAGNSGLVCNTIYALAADPVEDDVLWIGTRFGLMKMVYGPTPEFTHYYPGNSALGHESIYCLSFDEQHVLWVGTQIGAASFDGESWSNYNNLLPTLPATSYPTGIFDIDFDEYGRTWFATDFGMQILHNGECISYTTENSCLPVNAIRTIKTDGNGKAYINTYGCGLYVAHYSNPVSAEEPVVNVIPHLKHSNYPNPFNPETTISFTLPAEGAVNVDVFNLKGQKVQRLLSDDLKSGEHTVQWNGEDSHGKAVASGTYFYRIQFNNASYTRKMVLLK